jgi:N-acetyl-gamma-glutamyl-phosphate reductase
VAGASGYAGGELLRLLAGHPGFQIAGVTAGGKAGRTVGEVHPNLVTLASRTFAETTADLLADADLAFLALPHGESAALISSLPKDLPIVDLGADFRLTDSESWQKYYGSAHAGTWTYGLPEIPGSRSQIARSRRVANPGCYATAITLALAPLLAARLVQATDLVVVAASGTSGAGRSPVESLLATQVMGSMSAYKVGGIHQHTPEIEQSLRALAGNDVSLSFTPMLAPMPRGILATCTATSGAGVDVAAVRQALQVAYADEPFISVLPEGQWPNVSSVLGSNSAHLQVALDEHTARVVVVVAIDNLGKGAAGQAIQNANLILGLDEGSGLTVNGIAP